MRKLLDRISDLEAIKEKQALKLTKLREELEMNNAEVNKTRSSSDTAVQALSQELRHLKLDLERAQIKEKQVILLLFFLLIKLSFS
jgi:LEA14-like dessication related protein